MAHESNGATFRFRCRAAIPARLARKNQRLGHVPPVTPHDRYFRQSGGTAGTRNPADMESATLDTFSILRNRYADSNCVNRPQCRLRPDTGRSLTAEVSANA